MIIFKLFSSNKLFSQLKARVGYAKMTCLISEIPSVDIDSNGVFKYILIKLTVPNNDSEIETKDIVRGYASCEYHSDINDKVNAQLLKLKELKKIRDFRTNVLGGGRISHDANKKSINVYGYSQGYGKADHEIAVQLLKEKYADYTITCSDEGY